MQFKTLVVLSLSAAAMAAPEKRQAPTNSMDLVSLYQVLQTALPQSLIAEALTNSAAVSSEIASDFEHSMTPSWFSNLPTNIQTYLVPLVTNPTALASATAAAGNNTASVAPILGGGANATAAAAGNGTAMPTGAGVANTTAIGHNSTGVAAAQSSIQSSIHNQNSSAMASATGSGTVITGAGSSSSATGSSGSSSGSSGSSSGSSTSSSSAGASMPTAIYGMGLAGMVGLVGVFAL